MDARMITGSALIGLLVGLLVCVTGIGVGLLLMPLLISVSDGGWSLGSLLVVFPGPVWEFSF